MFVDLPKELILMTVGAFLLGWLLSSLGSRLNAKTRASVRDPRDDRIRSLEAELRVAQSEAAKSKEKLKSVETELEDANAGIEKRDNVLGGSDVSLRNLKVNNNNSIKSKSIRFCQVKI